MLLKISENRLVYAGMGLDQDLGVYQHDFNWSNEHPFIIVDVSVSTKSSLFTNVELELIQ